jgi:C-terminal processing protease CtpA/Prc
MQPALALAVVLTAVRAEAQRTPPPPDRWRNTVEIPATSGWVGITFTTGAKGEAVVSEVYEDSPADRAGVQEGDTIVQWNGSAEVGQAIRRSRLDPGDTVKVRIRRRGARDQDLSLRATRRPTRMASDRSQIRRLGDSTIVIHVPTGAAVRAFSDLTDSLVIRIDSMHQRLRIVLEDSLRQQLQMLQNIEIPQIRVELDQLNRDLGPGGAVFGFDFGGRSLAGAEFSPMNAGLASYFGTDHGILAVRVADGTPAARSGLRSGDVIVEANDTEVHEISDLRRAIVHTGRHEDRSVKLDVIRKGKRQEIQLRW